VLLAEDLLLLLTEDETGRHIVGSPGLDLALAGACLVELAMRGRIAVAERGEEVKAGRLVVRDPGPTGEPVLDDALGWLVERPGRKPESVLQPLSKKLKQRLLEGLAARGVVRYEERTVLAIFPVRRWPAADSSHEAAVRERLHAVLVDELSGDERTVALIGLLSAVKAAHRVVDGSVRGVDDRTIRKRAKEIRDRDWAAGAVSKSIAAVETAVNSAVMAAVIGGAAAGGS
jgi:hypothetical protein